MLFDLTKFFAAYTKAFGKLNSSQEAGLRFLLARIAADPAWPADLRFIAYFLATIKHETGNTFQPVKEKRERQNSPRRANQDRYWLTGEYGRGYVQITWDKNYRKFGLGPSERNKALEPETAYRIASIGMLTGTFTGKKLSNYFGPTKEDWANARRIINGLDCAEKIAVSARKLQACLSLALIKDTHSTFSGAEPPLSAPAFSSPHEAPSPSLTGRAGALFVKAREGYSKANESEKGVAARMLQMIWAGIAGLVAFVQTHPVQIGISIAVLLIGAYTIHTYIRRQDKKTFLKYQGGGA
jgi:putative chitinase